MRNSGLRRVAPCASRTGSGNRRRSPRCRGNGTRGRFGCGARVGSRRCAGRMDRYRAGPIGVVQSIRRGTQLARLLEAVRFDQAMQRERGLARKERQADRQRRAPDGALACRQSVWMRHCRLALPAKSVTL